MFREYLCKILMHCFRGLLLKKTSGLALGPTHSDDCGTCLRTLTIPQLPRFDSPASHHGGIKGRDPRRMSSLKTCLRTLTIPQQPRFDSPAPHTTEGVREGNHGECFFKTCLRTLTIPQLPRFDSFTTYHGGI